MRPPGACAGLALLALALVEAVGAAGCSGVSARAADAADADVAGDSDEVAGDAAVDADDVAADASDTADDGTDANDDALDAEQSDVADGADVSETSMPGEAGPGASACSQLCGMIDGLGCANAIPCLATCETTTSARCGDIYARWLACAGSRPASDFHCNAAGHGVLDDTQCEDQLFDFGDCLLAGP